MSRQTINPSQRSLSLTEDLERLEQSITLTLQEIDHNFSRAHRIVTSGILSVVEQYANHSRSVWGGAKFWKQFFEASANVSLSGYEEQQEGLADESVEDSNTRQETEGSESYETPSQQYISTDSIGDIDLSNLTLSPAHSTPRPPQRKNSPRKGHQAEASNISEDPKTPVRQTSSLIDDVAMTPQHSPDAEREQYQQSQVKDPIMHTMLDKNYRIQATPLTSRRVQKKKLVEPTLDSSPLAPPELHAEVFDSPIRRELTQQLNKPKTPGVSVLTPGRGKAADKPKSTYQPLKQLNVWDSDDDDLDDATGMPFGASPPKTMSFHVPQSRLIKTPAREASKQIVENILASAGVGRGGGEEISEDLDDLDMTYEQGNDFEDSPSVVWNKDVVQDDTF